MKRCAMTWATVVILPLRFPVKLRSARRCLTARLACVANMIDIIHRWAQRNQIHPHAIAQLLNMLGVGFEPMHTLDIPTGASEAAVQQRVRVAMSEAGMINWRNNVGAMMDDKGNMVRFGLCNDTAALNKKLKSSDLIAINKAPITPAMVGLPRGQFVAREVKEQGWKYTGTEHEKAQLAFGQIVIAAGGDFAFTTGGI